MKRKARIGGVLAVLLAAALSIGGCSSSKTEEYGYDSVISEEIPGGAMEGAANSAVMAVDYESGEPKAPRLDNRKLIVTMDMTLETENYDAACETILNRLKEAGGYVEYSETSRDYTKSGSMILRIPADRFDGFISSLGETGNILYESRNTEDVTLDYTDTESHKEALRIEQERLFSLLEKADTMEDILAIEDRLTSVRYELERYESRLRVYDNLIDYSTLELRIREVKKYTEQEPEKFRDRAVKGFLDNLESVEEGFVEFAIGLISVLPTLGVLLVVLAILAVIIKAVGVRRKNKKKKDTEKIEKNDEQ